MFRNEKFPGFVHPYNLLEYFQNKEIDSNKTLLKRQYTNDLSKKNSFLTEEAINYIARTEKRRYQHVKCLSPLGFCPLLSWKLKRGRSKTATSFKFELFCQWGNDFLILCFTKSSIIDDAGVRDPTLVCLFPVQNITKKMKI